MELIQNAFEQGLIPGIVIVIYLIINKIIDNNKRNPLDDIAKLLNIVTKDIIEKDREKSKAVISITMVNAASECAKFVASTIITNNVDNNRDQIEYNARHLVNSVYYSRKICHHHSVSTRQGFDHSKRDTLKERRQNKDITTLIYFRKLRLRQST